MFGFFSPLPVAAAQLLSFTLVTATGTVTFDSMTVAGTGAVATPGRRPLLLRGIPPRNLVARYLLKP